MNVTLALDSLVPSAKYFGSLTDNTQAAFDDLDWQDSRDKPSWPVVVEKDVELSVARLKDYLADKRWQAETGGIVVGVYDIPTDDRAKMLIDGSALMSESDTIKFKTANGWVDMTGAELTVIRDAIRQHVRACFAKEAELDGQITDGQITTTAQVNRAFVI